MARRHSSAWHFARCPPASTYLGSALGAALPLARPHLNVRSWHFSDLPDRPDDCLLLRVERTCQGSGALPSLTQLGRLGRPIVCLPSGLTGCTDASRLVSLSVLA